MIRERRFFVKGMHCASCELLIEKKLLELKDVKSVEASTARGDVLIEYEGKQPKISELNQLFSKEGYVFFEPAAEGKSPVQSTDFGQALVIGLLVVAAFIILEKTGLTALVNVNRQSSLPMFFVFGLLAGVSSCAALVGGMVLSMTKRWGEGVRPQLLFNLGRLITFFLLGLFLGLLGNRLQLSLAFISVLVMAVSLIMVISGLQLLGLKLGRKLSLTAPKPITRLIADESHFKGKWLPILLGGLTFFLPCGFTLTAQSLALLSGNSLQGGLIMLSFALGTLPMLLLIGFSSSKLFQNPHLSAQFSKVAGILVLFFAFYNLNSQFNRLGLPSLSDLGYKAAAVPVTGEKQLLKMEASAQGYKPNYFQVKANQPVRWEITDTGTSGCTNAIISRELFEGEIRLTPGQTSIKEFTPAKTGRYKFSCWMGMVTGIIEVVDEGGYSGTSEPLPTITAGQSCGCGGGK